MTVSNEPSTETAAEHSLEDLGVPRVADADALADGADDRSGPSTLLPDELRESNGTVPIGMKLVRGRLLEVCDPALDLVDLGLGGPDVVLRTALVGERRLLLRGRVL